ncbi:uncharacterized protein LOC131154415 isoform X2 [Malania oleifera]|uniref:uncharacterized protein LOC131154415 isoform X2 n=1 Tax=Malania oleifera TaxID=397392 RepID=UPI0025AE5995|nr:uncharacterized protein LOC131154415 isoform X2 [Malania oleifera]
MGEEKVGLYQLLQRPLRMYWMSLPLKLCSAIWIPNVPLSLPQISLLLERLQHCHHQHIWTMDNEIGGCRYQNSFENLLFVEESFWEIWLEAVRFGRSD